MPKNPIDYANGLQYKIVCKDPSITDCYNGSTCSLKDRKSEHKKRCNKPNSKAYNLKVYQFIREHGGWDNWTMVQLELSPCNTKQELVLREREIFDILKPTLNSYSPTLDVQKKKKTKAEYNATHRDEIKKYGAEYNATHKEELKKYWAEYNVTHREERKKWREDHKEAYKKYCEQNKDILSAKRKQHYEQNKVEIAARRKEQITCECGCVSTIQHLSRHQRTQNHLNLMAQK